MSLRIENEKELDFSKMEVLLKRGLKKSKVLPVVILYSLALIILWALATALLFANWKENLFIIIISYAIPIIFMPFFIISLVKFSHNKKLKHENLYFDKASKRFYLETSKGEIKSIDAKEDIRVGNNMMGFDEALVVYNGERINTGYTITELNATNRRINDIKNNL